jgi:hypothetical protein
MAQKAVSTAFHNGLPPGVSASRSSIAHHQAARSSMSSQIMAINAEVIEVSVGSTVSRSASMVSADRTERLVSRTRPAASG